MGRFPGLYLWRRWTPRRGQPANECGNVAVATITQRFLPCMDARSQHCFFLSLSLHLTWIFMGTNPLNKKIQANHHVSHGDVTFIEPFDRNPTEIISHIVDPEVCAKSLGFLIPQSQLVRRGIKLPPFALSGIPTDERSNPFLLKFHRLHPQSVVLCDPNIPLRSHSLGITPLSFQLFTVRFPGGHVSFFR